jgi:hypothetical protein
VLGLVLKTVISVCVSRRWHSTFYLVCFAIVWDHELASGERSWNVC